MKLSSVYLVSRALLSNVSNVMVPDYMLRLANDLDAFHTFSWVQWCGSKQDKTCVWRCWKLGRSPLRRSVNNTIYIDSPFLTCYIGLQTMKLGYLVITSGMEYFWALMWIMPKTIALMLLKNKYDWWWQSLWLLVIIKYTILSYWFRKIPLSLLWPSQWDIIIIRTSYYYYP